MIWLVIACLLDWLIIAWSFGIESFGKNIEWFKFAIGCMKVRVSMLESVLKYYNDRVASMQKLIDMM